MSETSTIGEVTRDEISRALQELENLKLDHEEGSIPSTTPDLQDHQGAFIPKKRRNKKQTKNNDTLRVTLENRLLLNDQITKKIHEKSKNMELENQRLREQIEQMDLAISSQVRMSELLKRLDEQEVVIQELTSYCESLENKCQQIENTYGSKENQDKINSQMKTTQQKLVLLEGKYETLKNAYQQLLNAKVDKFISNSNSSTKGKKSAVNEKNRQVDISQELVLSLKERINGLIQERTIEQNMHNSIAFELEAQVAKWYAECKMYKQQFELLKKTKSSKENPLNYVV